jgi:hypothetical protein
MRQVAQDNRNANFPQNGGKQPYFFPFLSIPRQFLSNCAIFMLGAGVGGFRAWGSYLLESY